MMPWRPLGRLSFGLTIIYLFIRLHGEGYDFPESVGYNNATIEHYRSKRPDRTFLEISPVYLAEEVLFTKESDFFQTDPEEGTEVQPDRKEGQVEKDKVTGGSGGGAGLWQSQWRKMKGSKENDASTQAPVDETEMDPLGSKGNERQWIWMTNLWYDDGDCGPGHIRQYRAPLDRAMVHDETSKWELMYTHKLPGPIVHASLSKRVFPSQKRSTRRSSTQNQDQDQDQSQDQTQDEETDIQREVIRLAVVFKVVQDEHVAYHSRIYHFGVLHRGKVDLRADCAAMSTETCHLQVPFQTFDYVLPGSTAIKDFSLEHDSILYSRLSDTVYFRSLQLPQLQPGSTSPERPYALSYGSPGPSMNCHEKRITPYRMSFLTQLQSYPPSEEPYTLMGKVIENHDFWEYHMMAATNVPEMMTGNKKWLSDPQRWGKYEQLVQQNDMVNDDPYIQGYSVQRPYMVKSSDGYSIHIPIKNRIQSLDMKSNTQYSQESNWQEDDDIRRNDRFMNQAQLENNNYNQYKIAGGKSESAPSDGAAAKDTRAYSQQQYEQQQRSSTRKHSSSSRKLSDRFVMPSTNIMGRWTESEIDAGAMELADTEQGVLNDRTDVMVLKNAHNGILVLRRVLGDTTYPTKGSNSNWELSMVMNDERYFEESLNRRILAMKVVRAPVPMKALPPSKSHVEEVVNKEGASENSVGGDSTSSAPEQELPVRYHNVLFLLYGNGNLTGHDLDQPQEYSATAGFLAEKYPVVIGMLAVVIAFVINEAR